MQFVAASSATNTRHVRRFGDFFARGIEASVSSYFHGAGRLLNACTRDHRPESRGLLCSRDAPFLAKRAYNFIIGPFTLISFSRENARGTSRHVYEKHTCLYHVRFPSRDAPRVIQLRDDSCDSSRPRARDDDLSHALDAVISDTSATITSGAGVTRATSLSCRRLRREKIGFEGGRERPRAQAYDRV